MRLKEELGDHAQEEVLQDSDKQDPCASMGLSSGELRLNRNTLIRNLRLKALLLKGLPTKYIQDVPPFITRVTTPLLVTFLSTCNTITQPGLCNFLQII